MVGHEVAHANRAHVAVSEQCLERAVRVEREVEPARQRLMKQEQVDAINTEFGRALLERVQRGVILVRLPPGISHVLPIGPQSNGQSSDRTAGLGNAGVPPPCTLRVPRLRARHWTAALPTGPSISTEGTEACAQQEATDRGRSRRWRS